jgi:hypothetical protein
MEAINRALNGAVDMHAGAAEEKIKTTLDGLNRLITELERPQNRELMRFVAAWERLNQELTALQIKINERLAEKPDKLKEFLQKLRTKN